MKSVGTRNTNTGPVRVISERTLPAHLCVVTLSPSQYTTPLYRQYLPDVKLQAQNHFCKQSTILLHVLPSLKV